MVGRKQTWWKFLVAVPLLSAVFVALGVTAFVPSASAQVSSTQSTTYSWEAINRIKVTKFEHVGLGSGNVPDFEMTCAGTLSSGISNCDSKRGSNTNGIPGICGVDLDFNGRGDQGTLTYYELVQLGGGDFRCNPKTETVKVINVQRAPSFLPDKSKEDGAAATETSNEDLQFECSLTPNPLSWIICPLYWSVNKIVGSLDNFINDLLTINQSDIFDRSKDSGQGYYKAWSTMRAFALGLLVIAGLIMVIAHALGFEVLDAYTIKKILPRLLIAVIAISVSWQLMQFFVVLTNNLGLGIRQVIYYPFADMQGSLVLGGGATFIAAILSAGAFLALGPLGLLSFAATALLAVGVAFLVLMIRQLVIVVLILIAPIAIACSILPNTQGAYKLWYESFTKALMMFPIIVAFIAVGRVFAVVALQGGAGPDVDTAVVGAAVPAFNQIIGFAAYFLPYFLIPMTFSLAGGAMRFLGGQMNDRSRGGFDRLKKYRANTMARRGHDWRNGSLYQNRGAGKLINNAGRRAGVGARGRFGIGRTGKAAMGTAALAGAQDTLKNNANLNELRNNDDANAVMALSGGSRSGAREAASNLRQQWMDEKRADYTTAQTRWSQAQADFSSDKINATQYAAANAEHEKAKTTYDGAESSVNERVRNAYAAANGVGFSRQNATAAMTTVAQNKSRAISNGRADIIQAGMNRLAQGNEGEMAGMQGAFQYFSREAGRADLGGTWSSGTIQENAKEYAAKAGISEQRAVADMTALDGMERTDVSALLRGHTAQTKQNAETLKRLMIHGDVKQKEMAATRLLELQKNISYAPGANQAIINETLQSKEIGVDFADTTRSIEQQLASRVNKLNAEQAKAGDVVKTLDATELTRIARTYDRETYDRENMPGGK